MLGVSTYTQDHIDQARRRIAEQVSTYDDLVATTGSGGGPDTVDAFAGRLFENLVIVLDHLFMHRLRGREGKDGNPANEVRMLSLSLVEHGGVLTADKTIKYEPETSVLGLAVGDRVTIDQSGFARLAEAYFAEIEKRFT
jgi:hypothetical protein